MKNWYSAKWFSSLIFSVILLAACSPAANPTPPAPTATLVPATSTALPATATVTVTAPAPTLTYEQSVQLFDYDQTRPLDVQELSVEEREGVAVHDISYAAYDPALSASVNGRITAYLVTPAGQGPFAGIVFMHWLGEHNSNREEFLEEALALAHQGAVSLLVEGIFPWHKSPSGYEADKAQVINQVIELRRALDLLLSQPGVDPQRIGYVGHDYGAMYGAVLSGIDPRVKAYVLMAGMGNFSDWSLKYWPATGSQGKDTYRQALAAVDPIAYIGHAEPASLFFQFARQDKYISEQTATQFYEAASNPKEIGWYETAHPLNTEEDLSDRNVWLSGQLGLKE